MNLIGEEVKHKAFEVGKIIDFQEQRMTIQFEACSNLKKFNYPESIGSYLELKNDELYDQVIENQVIFALKDAEYKRLNAVSK